MFFGRSNPNFKMEGDAILARVETFRNREVIHVRISTRSELSQSGRGYFVRKHLTGVNSFDKAVLEVHLNRFRRVQNATVDGGELIPVKYWKDD